MIRNFSDEDACLIDVAGEAQNDSADDSAGKVVVDERIIRALREVIGRGEPDEEFDSIDLSDLDGLSVQEALVWHEEFAMIMINTVRKVAAVLHKDPRVINKQELKDQKLDPDIMNKADWFKNTARCFRETGHLDHALEAYTAAFVLIPEDIEVCEGIADICYLCKDYSNALEYYQRGLDHFSEEGHDRQKFVRKLAEINAKLGKIYMDEHVTDEKMLEQNLDKAYRYYSAALENLPNYVPALCGLGSIAYLDREYKDAVSHYQQALAADPTSASVKIELGKAYAALNELKAAGSYLEEAVTSNPSDPAALFQLAKFQLHNLKSEVLARQNIDLALAAEPENPSFLLLSAELDLKAKKIEQAFEKIQHILKIDPDNREAFKYYTRHMNGHGRIVYVNPVRRELSRDFMYSLRLQQGEVTDEMRADYASSVWKDHEERFEDGQPKKDERNPMN
jgi:tetratricopeptide (TPR) repeat protein